MAYSELIKNFDRIRDYMREFYVYGFKSREGFDKKSARSYDNERRRVESWLGDYMRFRLTPKGKTVFLSVDSRVTRRNPLYAAWKTKSFTDGDITLHFLLFDILHDPAVALTLPQIMDEIAQVTPSFRGISHARLDATGGLQWPCPGPEHPGTPIMHVGQPARGKALFYPAQYQASRELPDDEYPFILMTGRILYHYNAAAMTSRAPGLMDLSGEGFIEVNFRDAKRLGIVNGERVKVGSRRGEITATARVGRKVSEGETWMPFHFEDSPVNILTNAALDEFARIPEYKVCAIWIRKM